MTALGILNPNSRMKAYGREMPALPSLITTDAPILATVRALAEQFYAEQQAGILVLSGGLNRKGALMVQEAETKLTMLAAYADELAEVVGNG